MNYLERQLSCPRSLQKLCLHSYLDIRWIACFQVMIDKPIKHWNTDHPDTVSGESSHFSVLIQSMIFLCINTISFSLIIFNCCSCHQLQKWYGAAWVPKYLYFNLTAIYLFNTWIHVSHEFEAHDLRVNLFTCGEFYSLVFNSLLRTNVFTLKELYCLLFSNLDGAIFLISLVITNLKNINNSKTERFFIRPSVSWYCFGASILCTNIRILKNISTAIARITKFSNSTANALNSSSLFMTEGREAWKFT